MVRAPDSRAQATIIRVLFASTIEGDPNVKVDARAAAAFGAGAVLMLFVLRRLFKRS